MKLTASTLLILVIVTGCSPAKKRDGKATFVTQGQPLSPSQSQMSPTAPVAPVETKTAEVAQVPTPSSSPTTPTASPTPVATPLSAAPQTTPTSTHQLQLPKSSASALEALTAPLRQAQESQSKASGLNNEQSAKQVRAQLDGAAAEAEQRAPTTPVSEEDSVMWPKLVEYIADHGVKDESPMGFYVSLIHFSNNDPVNPPHISNHISVVGGFNAQQQFAISRMEAVWADVKMNAEGNKDSDQWMFLTSKTGALAKYWRYHLVKKPNDTVLVHQGLNVTEAEAIAKWEQVRKDWYKRIQKK